jgi:hypothetical protein
MSGGQQPFRCSKYSAAAPGDIDICSRLTLQEAAPGEHPSFHPIRDVSRRRDRADHLDRPRTANAQSRGLLVELDQPFMAAEADDQVRVVILAAPQFSSGHDMGSKEAVAERDPVLTSIPRCASTGGTRAGAE